MERRAILEAMDQGLVLVWCIALEDELTLT